jgi:hypothetical protein
LTSSAPYFCQDSASSNWSCAGAPCDTADKVARQPASVSLRLLLHRSSSIVYVQYGEAAPYFLGPCGSMDQNRSCGAVAYEEASAGVAAGAGRVLVDRTGDIRVLDVTSCPRGKVGL